MRHLDSSNREEDVDDEIPNKTAMTQFFAFDDWPNGEASIVLGGRELIIIPTPGHQEEAISVSDPQTRWLLTGDAVFPGDLYVKNWINYKKSIAHLVSFSDGHDISMVLGCPSRLFVRVDLVAFFGAA